MGTSRDDLPLDDSDASLKQEDAPPSSRRPAHTVSDAPPANDDALSSVSPEELRAFLGQADVQRRIRDVVRARLGKGAPPQVLEDIVQEANLAMLASRARPRSMATASGWVSTAARRAVVHYFRRGAADGKWLDREVDVEQQSGEAGQPPGDGWLVGKWLAQVVQQSPTDQETFELLVYKAQTGKPYEQVAADHGISATALRSRVHEFKKKYEPRWRRRQGMLVLLLLLAAGVVALALWLLTRPEQVEIRPDPAPPAPRPTASASATPFEPAQPPRPVAPPPNVPEKSPPPK